MKQEQTERDWNGLLVALGCIALGGWVLYESSSYSRFAAIFPRTISIVMMVAAAAWVIQVAVGSGRRIPIPPGSILRPLALIGVGAGWALLIPQLGFFAASVIGFLGAMLVGKFHAWSGREWALHVTLAVVITGGIYTLFAWGLNVPL